MYKSDFSRRGDSPLRRPTSPELPPFPGDYLRHRHTSPALADYRPSGDYGSRLDDYPSSPRGCSPRRFGGDLDRAGDYRRKGDFYRRDYEKRLREGSPRTEGDYEDYFCRDNTELGRISERRSRAPSAGRDRRSRTAAEEHSPKRRSALSPGQYEEYSRRPYRASRRSLSPVPYYGYSTIERAPHQREELNVRERFASPSSRQPDTMNRRYNRRMGGNYGGYANEMASRYRRDNDRRRDSSPEEEQVSQLPHVERVEFYIPQNAREHHTLEYELVKDRYRADPVLRRGQPFYLAIRLDRELDNEREKLYVLMKYGPRAEVTLGTKVYLPVNKREFTKEKQHWDCRIHGIDGSTLVLQVQIPNDCLVGDWSASVQTVTGGSGGRRRAEFKCRENVYILFNPWCPEDPCYMENDAEREEYVNNDNGKIFVGTHKQQKGRHWVFGQHDNSVLPAVQLILEMSGLSHAERGSPVKVVRALTGALHSTTRDGNDGPGVLEARWGSEEEGQYKGGVTPWTWTGSVRILEQFLRSGGTTVKYGQCWVFSGLLTTVCRALGIPCRSVTNFVSAHDTDGTLTVDKFFDYFGEEIENGPSGNTFDSLWNFHVWNDAWMARPDLPQGYGGWQAIDATPQQESDNKYQCGPSSLEAVRRGEVGFGFDTTFLFSEVNADFVHWREDEESDWGFSKMKRSSYHVGRSVLTKRCGAGHDDDDDDAEDITHIYKNPEGTAAERLSVFNAVKATVGAQKYFDYPDSEQEDVVFELAEIDQVMIGQPFHFDVSVVNKSAETRTVKAFLHANSMYYTGVKGLDIIRVPVEFTLMAGQTEKIVVEITPEKYMAKLVDYAYVKIHVMANVTETRQAWSEEDDFVISKPKLTVQPEEPCVVGKRCRINFTFVNPLDAALTGCMFSFEGSGLTKPRVSKLRSIVEPHETFSHSETFVPRVAGTKTVVASFQCLQLFDIEGSKTFTVSA